MEGCKMPVHATFDSRKRENESKPLGFRRVTAYGVCLLLSNLSIAPAMSDRDSGYGIRSMPTTFESFHRARHE